jgi:hypothetical protein
MVCIDRNNSQLWVSKCEGTDWHPTRQIDGQYESLRSTEDWLVMTYRDAVSSQFWCTRSPDGLTWHDTAEVDGQHGDTLGPRFLSARRFG